MTLKIASVLLVIVGYVLVLWSTIYGFSLAKKKHGVNLKDVKNEIPNGYTFRAICSLIYYVCIFDWIFDFGIMRWAYLPYGEGLNISGLILLSLTVGLFWWIHIALGSNYNGPMTIYENHELVKSGPFAYVRHPTYLGFPLLHISLALITHNYILLIAGMSMAIYVNSKRIIVEEDLLTEKFGEAYLEYKNSVGKYFPRIRRAKKKA